MALGERGEGLTGRRPREPLPDALRALALIGVLVVNGLGYQDVPYGRVLGEVRPADSFWAQGLLALVAAFVQGKAYPVLAFLFGMGMAYAARGQSARAALQNAERRARRLMLLGVLHGILLYYGDILTIYALCALWVARQMRQPWRQMRRRLERAVLAALLAVAASIGLALLSLGGPAPQGTIGTVAGYRAFLGLNAGTYLVAQVFGLLLTLPVVRLAMLAGVAATRLRLLTHRRWRGRAARLLQRWLLPVAAANAAYALAYISATPSPPAWQRAVEAGSALWAMPLALLYVAAASRAWHAGRRRWMVLLAPLGQHTLSIYVGASLLMLWLFSGAGLALQPTTAGWLLYALALWALAWVASAVLRGRWPLEAWIARR
jgi:uncharacterized protein